MNELKIQITATSETWGLRVAHVLAVALNRLASYDVLVSGKRTVTHYPGRIPGNVYITVKKPVPRRTK